MTSLISRLDEIPSIPNHDEPSSEYLEELICELRARRNSANWIPLTQLAKNCILRNAVARFIPASRQYSKKYKNPFEILPSSLALSLLEDASKIMKIKPYDLPLCLVLQLLNPQILQFDIDKYVNASDERKISIFSHLLKNCPKLRSIQISRQIWEKFTSPKRARPEDIFAIMAFKWSNLKCLDLAYFGKIRQNDDGVFAETDGLLEAISSSLPDLVYLKAKFSMDAFTMAGVGHLSKMKKLKHLDLHLHNVNPDEHPFPVVVHAAGRVPALEKFVFRYYGVNGKFWGSFADMYGKLYPNKPLVVSLVTREDLENTWPSCLNLETLEVHSNRSDL